VRIDAKSQKATGAEAQKLRDTDSRAAEQVKKERKDYEASVGKQPESTQAGSRYKDYSKTQHSRGPESPSRRGEWSSSLPKSDSSDFYGHYGDVSEMEAARAHANLTGGDVNASLQKLRKQDEMNRDAKRRKELQEEAAKRRRSTHERGRRR